MAPVVNRSNIILFQYFSILALLLSALSQSAQTAKDSLEKLNYLKKIVYTLADDSMNGRGVSTIYEQKAAQFIFQELKKMKGVKPQYHDFIYQKADTAIARSSQNIYCYINNKADSTVIISAHYDHIEPNSYLSQAFSQKKQIHNGADDNASGVALLLGLVKNKAAWMNKTVNYVFVFYSAHEIGLYGSTAFYTHCKLKFSPIRAVLNFDLVGRLDLSYNPQITFYGSGTISEVLRNDIKLKEGKVKFDMDKSSNINYSDCRPFLKNGIPCLWLTTGSHNDYHKPSDDPQYIKYDGMYVIQRILETKILNAKPYKK